MFLYGDALSLREKVVEDDVSATLCEIRHDNTRRRRPKAPRRRILGVIKDRPFELNDFQNLGANIHAVFLFSGQTRSKGIETIEQANCLVNPFNDRYDDFILPWNTSSAEEIQKRFPRTRVAGAFKNVWWEVTSRSSTETSSATST